MEQSLQTLEYLATLAKLSIPSYTYPQEELDEIWRDVLINQFHDVLPGTSIALANIDVMDIYQRRIEETQHLIDMTLEVLTTPAEPGQILIVDPLRIPRHQIVEVDGTFHLTQIGATGSGQVIPPPKSRRDPSAYKDGDTYVLENRHVRMSLCHGRIMSLFDRELNKELIAPSTEASGGGLMLHQDMPLRFDAWDIEIYHLNSFQALEFTTIEIKQTGSPLVAALTATSTFGISRATLIFSLDAASGTVKVDADIDWYEKHKVLKCKPRLSAVCHLSD